MHPYFRLQTKSQPLGWAFLFMNSYAVTLILIALVCDFIWSTSICQECEAPYMACS